MSFIMNLMTSFRNSKWPIDYGGQKAKNYPTLMQIGISGFLGVSDYESAFIFFKLMIAGPIWRKKNKNYPMLIKIRM